MSAAIYREVERAIAEKLHICGRYRTPTGGPSYEYPVAIERGNIILRDGDCGEVKETREITPDEWRSLAEYGLFRSVGIWNFVRADDEAADAIAFCYRNPDSAGRELHRLRNAPPRGE